MENKTKTAITLSQVTVCYHKQAVLESVSITIPQGVLCAVIGANGTGKSTLLKTITGLITPQRGTVAFTPTTIRIAYIPQRHHIDWHFPITVFDFIMMGRYPDLAFGSRPTKNDYQQVQQALQKVELVHQAHTPIAELSGGQQQRMFIARALVQHADLYLLDEPFIGIDAATQEKIWILLHELHTQGKTIIIVHHNLEELSIHFNWLILLEKNKVHSGQPSQILPLVNLSIPSMYYYNIMQP